MTTSEVGSLTPEELALWHGFKRAGESLRTAVAEDITRVTGLSDPDFGIVSRLADAGDRMRQNDLAVSMGWHRSRLSHQLTRMADRGLVVRSTVDAPAGASGGGASGGPGVEVALTDAGRAAAELARPVHAAAVRRHLLDRIPAGDRDRLVALLDGLMRRRSGE